MARITEKVKIYIYLSSYTDELSYFTTVMDQIDWLTLVGTTEALIDFDEASLMDPRDAQLNQAEQELETHRAEFAVKERQLLDRIESFRALPHLGVAGARVNP